MGKETDIVMQPILIVEDSHEDFNVTVRSLKSSHVANPIFHCETGDEALDYLYQRGAYTDPESAPRPGIILLDLNLPGTDGRDILGEIKVDSALKAIPVVILTTSSDERDIEFCYQAGANSYIPKPVTLDGFIKALEMLKDYWFSIVVLPKPKEIS